MAYSNVGIEGATTKKALKEKVAADPSTVYAYATGMDNGFNGTVDTLQPGLKLSVTGPNPYTKRDWYATIERTTRGLKVT